MQRLTRTHLRTKSTNGFGTALGNLFCFIICVIVLNQANNFETEQKQFSSPYDVQLTRKLSTNLIQTVQICLIIFVLGCGVAQEMDGWPSLHLNLNFIFLNKSPATKSLEETAARLKILNPEVVNYLVKLLYLKLYYVKTVRKDGDLV